MKRMTKQLISLLLSVMMLVTMFPVSAFATEQEIIDSGTPPQSEDAPKHWLQEYQEYVLSQLNDSSGPRKAIGSFPGPAGRKTAWFLPTGPTWEMECPGSL